MIRIAIFVVCFSAALAEILEPEGLTFEDCGSIYDIVSVNISSCSYMPCFIPIDRRVPVYTEFEYMGAPINQILKHDVSYILNNVASRAIIKPEGCDGRRCPVKTQNGYGFTADLVVMYTSPTLRGTLVWKSINVAGKVVVCFKVPMYFGYP